MDIDGTVSMPSRPADLEIYHVKSYSAISPEQASLSTEGKTVVIAGVDSDGVGAAIARSFAASGATNIALLGKFENTLSKSSSSIKASYPTINIEYFVTDLKSTESMGIAAHHVRKSLGAWDVFVHATSTPPATTTLVGADTDEWWECFEENVRPIHHFAKHFIPKKRPSATYISLVSRDIYKSVMDTVGSSAFVASQSARLKLNEIVAAEHPDMRIFNLDDGRYRLSPKFQKSVAENLDVRDDIAELCGDFCVWLTSPEPNFLRGELLCCNWDVSELVARRSVMNADPFFLERMITRD